MAPAEAVRLPAVGGGRKGTLVVELGLGAREIDDAGGEEAMNGTGDAEGLLEEVEELEERAETEVTEETEETEEMEDAAPWAFSMGANTMLAMEEGIEEEGGGAKPVEPEDGGAMRGTPPCCCWWLGDGDCAGGCDTCWGDCCCCCCNGC